MYRKIVGIIICMLLISTTIFSISGKITKGIDPLITSQDSILYVGGSGPNNYTTIQEGINAAVDGDTVYVYDDSAPYIESITIDKSINVIGENKDTTIIDGDGTSGYCVVNISSNDVTLSSFTIQANENNFDGIFISRSYKSPWNTPITNIQITNIIIKTTNGRAIFGICLQKSKIHQNIVEKCRGGIVTDYSSHNQITRNTISYSQYGGIEIGDYSTGFPLLDRIRYPADTINNTIQDNIITYNRWGIRINDAEQTTINHNHFTHNYDAAIRLTDISDTSITENNFMKTNDLPYTQIELEYYSRLISLIPSWRNHRSNQWDANYWGEPVETPKLIEGMLSPSLLYLCLLSEMQFIFIEILFNKTITLKNIQVRAYDWHPSQEPYDIRR
jgi:parallel beta-helix repeat protein